MQFFDGNPECIISIWQVGFPENIEVNKYGHSIRTISREDSVTENQLPDWVYLRNLKSHNQFTNRSKRVG